MLDRSAQVFFASFDGGEAQPMRVKLRTNPGHKLRDICPLAKSEIRSVTSEARAAQQSRLWHLIDRQINTRRDGRQCDAFSGRALDHARNDSRERPQSHLITGS